MTTHVNATTIVTLKTNVRSASGQDAIAGPSRASMTVMTAYAPAHVRRASL
jgi:hypothetical protein